MLVAAYEGQGFCYEVVKRTEAFLVRQRCLRSLSRSTRPKSRLFRTALVTLRFTEMSACFDRSLQLGIAGEEAESELAELGPAEAFERLSCRLLGEGIAAIVLDAWARADEERDRRRHH